MKNRITLAIAVVLFLCSRVSFAQTFTAAASLELENLTGQTFRIADYKGKVVLVNFWATWCPPCRTEIPELIKWQREYRGRGLQVVGITYPPQTLSQVRRFARRVGVNYPVALGSSSTKLLFTPSETLPMTVVFDSGGNLREVIEGIVFPEEFDQKIKPLLSTQTAGPVKTQAIKRKLPAVQRATIVVGAEGYRPTNLRLRRGVPTRLTFIRRVAEGCGTEIVIPAYGINRPLPLNVPVVVSFIPKKSGRIKLTCGMDMFRGSLIVR